MLENAGAGAAAIQLPDAADSPEVLAGFEIEAEEVLLLAGSDERFLLQFRGTDPGRRLKIAPITAQVCWHAQRSTRSSLFCQSMACVSREIADKKQKAGATGSLRLPMTPCVATH